MKIELDALAKQAKTTNKTVRITIYPSVDSVANWDEPRIRVPQSARAAAWRTLIAFILALPGE